jgi:xylan 1,4-beta-xylosidase
VVEFENAIRFLIFFGKGGSMKYPFKSAVITAFLAVFFLQSQAANYNLTVMGNHRTQAWNRFYETAVATDHMNTVIHTYWGRGIGNALKVGHNEAGFKYFRGHAVLDADVGLVVAASATSLTLNWTRFDSVYDIGVAAGMRPIMEISCTPPPLASNATELNTGANYNGVSPNKSPPTKYGWGPWVALMDSIVTHCENKWGVSEVRNNWYFEVWNEPDWWYAGFPQPYLSLFDYTVYGLKLADSLVRVGGPACEGTNIFQGGANFTNLLNHCHTGYDSATGKTGTKIDFLTYHWYADNATGNIAGAVLNANNSAAVQKMVEDSMRAAKYNWFTGPVFEDEMGPTYNPAVCRDMQQSASWLAKTVHLLNEGGPNYPPPPTFAYWAISDLYEENMISTSNLSFQQGNYGLLIRGDSTYANSWDIEKPIFQAYRLLHKLGSFEDSSYGGSTANGVNLVATSDSANDSMQVLIYDHYASTSQSSVPTDSINLTINNIPWAPGAVKIDCYLVDTTHSNTYTRWVTLAKPAAPTHVQWDSIRAAATLYDTVMTRSLATATTPLTLAFSQHYYSVMLLVLSNPSAVSVKHQSEATLNAAPTAMRAVIHGSRMMLTLPENDRYTVRLLSASGRTIVEARTSGSGTAGISLPKIPAGVYTVHCTGMHRCYAAQVVVAQ